MKIRPVVGVLALLAGLNCAYARVHEVEPGESIQAAIGALQPGDTLVIRGGTYEQSVTIRGLRGTADRPITIRGETNTVLRPAARDGIQFWDDESVYVRVEGLRIEKARRAAILIGGGRHITVSRCVLADNGMWGLQTCLSADIAIEDCEVYGSVKQHGVYFSTTERPAVRRCRIHHNGGCGVHFNASPAEGGDGMITGALVADNLIHENGRRGGSAINMDGVEQSVVTNNLLCNNYAGGIAVFHEDTPATGDGNRIERNTVVFRPDQGRYAFQLTGGGKATMLRNNILVCGSGPALTTDDASVAGLQSDGNVFFVHGKGPLIAVGERALSLRGWRRLTSQDGQSCAMDPAAGVAAGSTLSPPQESDK